MERLFEEQQLHKIIANLEVELRRRCVIFFLLLRSGRISKKRYAALVRVYGSAMLALKSYHVLLSFMANSDVALPRRIRFYDEETLQAISNNLEGELKRQKYIWRMLVRAGRMTLRQGAEKIRIYTKAINAVRNYGAFLSFL
jgi:hypothetical protein